MEMRFKTVEYTLQNNTDSAFVQERSTYVKLSGVRVTSKLAQIKPLSSKHLYLNDTIRPTIL